MSLAATGAGTLPPIGLGLAGDGRPLAPADAERLRRLHLAHLHVPLDLSDATWPATLERGIAEGAAVGAALELEVVAGDDGTGGDGLERLAEALADLASGSGPGIARAFVYPRGGVVTTERVMVAARRALSGAGIPLLGGGTRADFVNLNRAAAAGELPLDLLDAVAFAISPQVHAFDDLSLVETLACQAVVLANARRIAGDRPVSAGPVTLRQRLNPAATDPTDPAEDGRAARGDPRRPTLFAAGWTLGSVRHLATARAASLTYFETAGPLGVMEREGPLFPLYHLFAALAPFAGGDLLEVRPSDPLAVEALAVRRGDRLRLLVANLTGEPQGVTLETPGVSLDGPRLLEAAGAEPWTAEAARAGTLDLPPFALALLDGRTG